MTKKIVSALILVVMLISLVPAAAFAANTTDTDYFVSLSKNTAQD